MNLTKEQLQALLTRIETRILHTHEPFVKCTFYNGHSSAKESHAIVKTALANLDLQRRLTKRSR